MLPGLWCLITEDLWVIVGFISSVWSGVCSDFVEVVCVFNVLVGKGLVSEVCWVCVMFGVLFFGIMLRSLVMECQLSPLCCIGFLGERSWMWWWWHSVQLWDQQCYPVFLHCGILHPDSLCLSLPHLLRDVVWWWWCVCISNDLAWSSVILVGAVTCNISVICSSLLLIFSLLSSLLSSRDNWVGMGIASMFCLAGRDRVSEWNRIWLVAAQDGVDTRGIWLP